MDEVFTIGRFMQICLLACVVLVLTHWYYFKAFERNPKSIILKYFLLVLVNATITTIGIFSGSLLLIYIIRYF